MLMECLGSFIVIVPYSTSLYPGLLHEDYPLASILLFDTLDKKKKKLFEWQITFKTRAAYLLNYLTELLRKSSN